MGQNSGDRFTPPEYSRRFMFALFAPPTPTDALASRGFASTLEPPGKIALKRLVWLYFWLLIFEGALRKWVVPGFSNQLLLIRDPVVVLIYITAGMAGVFPRNGLIAFTAVLGFVSFLCSEAFGSGNLLVTLYGIRTTFLHLPLIFVLPHALDRKDVEKMVKWMLIAAIPMAFLAALQFRSPPDAWVNNGAGGGIGAQLTVGFGKIRPPGTFSFTAGLGSFTAGVAAIAIFTQMKKSFIHQRLAVSGLIAVTGLVLVSGSRGTVGFIVMLLAAVAFICAQNPKLAGRGLRVVVALAAASFVLGSFSEVRTGVEVHQSRLESGGGLREGIFLRVFSGFAEPFIAVADAKFFGSGLGMGTNGATGFMNGGDVSFKYGEGDWGRTIREMGPILGFLHIGLRIAIICFLARRSYDSLRRDNPLPLLLFASVVYEMLCGQFGVPSLLGLAIFKGGFCLATANLDAVTAASPEEEFLQQPAPVIPLMRGFRGRSAYAEQLHGDVENPVTQRFGP